MHEPAEFVEIVGELEVSVGRRLNGPGRKLCLLAFEENERGFHACALEALRRGRTNPLGLLVKMVKQRDWDVRMLEPEAPTAAPFERPVTRGRGSCFVCGDEVDEALFVGGQWWCSKHEGQAPA
jgi:hypothetical protein